MVNHYVAYTAPINPSGASPILSREQIWKGMIIKVRRPQDYVPIFAKCDILEEKENIIVREAHRKDGSKTRQTCKMYYPSRIDFIEDSGVTVSNVVSDGPASETDFHMTFTFERRHSHVQEGSEEAHRLFAQHQQMAKESVHSAIELLRKQAAGGELD